MSFYKYRQLGINYIRYSAICAKAVRHALKPELRAAAMKRGSTEDTIIKQTLWEAGRPVTQKLAAKN